MSTVQVRYIVNDLDAAIAFYTEHLGFHEDMHPAPAFAMLSRGDLRLVLSAPTGQDRAGGRLYPTDADRRRGDGIASPFRLTTSPTCQSSCAKQALSSAATSSRASEGAKPSSMIHPATPLSCSNPPDQKRA